jgi:precorrin-8X/cobalt-precorrin-8 methylmutase
MVGAGIIRRYLPANNQVIVTLNDPRISPITPRKSYNTKPAAAVEFPHTSQAQLSPLATRPPSVPPARIDRSGLSKSPSSWFSVGFVGAAELRPTGQSLGDVDFIVPQGRKVFRYGLWLVTAAACRRLLVMLNNVCKSCVHKVYSIYRCARCAMGVQ